MLEYFAELRLRVIYVLFVFGCCFVVFFYFSEDLFALIINPVLKNMPSNGKLIATTITGPVFVKINLALNFAFIVATLFFLYQLWCFVYPALLPAEGKHLSKIILSSIALFGCGIGFSYLLVLPLIFKFLIGEVLEGVHLLPDISYTINFICRMILVFGLCFQLPLITVILVKTNLLKLETLKHYRPHFIVTAFIIGMIFTPPDVFSQVMLALPMIVLYEFGLFLSSRV